MATPKHTHQIGAGMAGPAETAARGPVAEEKSGTPAAGAQDQPARVLTPEAQRALAEAEARRAAAAAAAAKAPPKEIGGPKGPDPTRYGDWEKGGITSDF